MYCRDMRRYCHDKQNAAGVQVEEEKLQNFLRSLA